MRALSRVTISLGAIFLLNGCGLGLGGLTNLPTISGVNPLPFAGPTIGGIIITLSGTGLKVPKQVLIGDKPCTKITANAAGTSISCTTPAGTGTAPVLVVTGVGSVTAPLNFHYETTPTLTRLSPAAGG